MATSSKDIEKFYNQIAGQYSKTRLSGINLTRHDSRLLNEFARRVRSSGQILDLGCGTGEASYYLNQLGLSASGLDLSNRLILLARRQFPDVKFSRGDMLNLHTADQSIDAIVTFYAMAHFKKPDLERALMEIHRVLKPGGLLLMTYFIGFKNLKLDRYLGRKINVEFITYRPGFIDQLLIASGFCKLFRIIKEPVNDLDDGSMRSHVFAYKSR